MRREKYYRFDFLFEIDLLGLTALLTITLYKLFFYSNFML